MTIITLAMNLWEIKDEEDPKIWVECLIEADDSPDGEDRDIWDAFEATVPALKAHFLAEFPLDPIEFGHETREELWRALYGAAVNANEAKIRSIRPVEL